MKIHILHEDAEESTTTEFWKMFIGDGPNFDVKGLGGYNNLRLYVTTRENINPKDFYIVFMDYVYDSRVIEQAFEDMEIKIKQYNMKNVYIPKVICFEYVLLTFNELEKWVRPAEINASYEKAVKRREELLSKIRNTMRVSNNEVTSEQAVTYILQEICKHHKGFVYSKKRSKLGKCWIKECDFHVNCNGCKHIKDISALECRRCTRCNKCALSNYGISDVTFNIEAKACEIICNSILYDVLIEAKKQYDLYFGKANEQL